MKRHHLLDYWLLGMFVLGGTIGALFLWLRPTQAEQPNTPVRASPAALPSQSSSPPHVLAGRIDERYWLVTAPLRAAASSGEMTQSITLVRERYQGLVRVDDTGAVQSVVIFAADAPWDLDTTERVLEALGVTVEHTSETIRAMQCWIPASLIERVARIPGVVRVMLPSYAIPNTGSVVSEGDQITQANLARQTFGVSGKGIRVGVIADGVDHYREVGDNLPSTLTIAPGLAGSGDEGTAMLEIVHDIAPGATLFFCSGLTNIQMLSCLEWMKDQRVQVIVDDLTFMEEPYFTDGPIAKAVNALVDRGVVYLTVAGNYGLSHYQGKYVYSQNGFHAFSGDEQDPDQLLEVTLGPGTTRIVLQWSDPPSASSNNYDLILYTLDPIRRVASSRTVQNGDDAPIEVISYTNPSEEPVTIGLAVLKDPDAETRELEIILFGGDSHVDPMHRIANDAVTGHAAAVGVITVGAINAHRSSQGVVSDYSSRGPSTVYTDFDRQQRWSRDSLGGASIDAVQSRIGRLGYFPNPFYGTSAAAPHVAGIAALMLEARPTLTPGDIQTILESTTDDIYDPGYDHISGSGRFDAYTAISRVLSSDTPPKAPKNLPPKRISDTEVQLNWEDASDNEQGFRIQRRDEGAAGWYVVATVVSNTVSYNDIQATCNITQEYQIYAYNSAGRSPAPVIKIFNLCENRPAAPTNLLAERRSDSEVALSWRDRSDNETSFRVQRRVVGNTGWELLKVLGANSQNYLDTQVVCGTTYEYQVFAFNSDGRSGTAETTIFVPCESMLVIPDAPTTLRARRISDTHVLLMWEDHSNNEYGFTIQRRLKGMTAWSTIGSVGPDTEVLMDTNAHCGTTYEYQVFAHNNVGASPPTTTTFQLLCASQLVPPTPPTLLVAKQISGTEVLLTWQDQSDNEQGFTIQRRVRGLQNWYTVNTVGSDVQSYRDRVPICGASYEYQVFAFNDSGNSDPVQTIESVVCGDTFLPPAPPTFLRATRISDTAVLLTWEDNSENEQGFRIQRREQGANDWEQIGSTAQNTTVYRDTTVVCATTYDYEVFAFNAAGSSKGIGTTIAVTCTQSTLPPLPPRNLQAIPIASAGIHGIKLTWEDRSDYEDVFTIERSPAGANEWTVIATVAANNTAYTDTFRLRCNTPFDYRVSASNAYGTSDYVTATVTTAPCPDNPDVGDCNADGKVNAADIPAVILRIRQDRFAKNRGCDANNDGLVDEQDEGCVRSLIFGRQCSSAGEW